MLQEHDKETGQQSLALFNPQNDPDSPGEQAKLEQYDKLGGRISDKLSERLRLRAQVHESPNPKPQRLGPENQTSKILICCLGEPLRGGRVQDPRPQTSQSVSSFSQLVG